MTPASHLEMHREHLRWQADDAMWRDDVATWEAEVDRAIKEMPRFEHALRHYADLLRMHAAAIRLYEQEFCTHEHTLANSERGQQPPYADSSEEFIRDSEIHDVQRRNHEHLKQQHYRLMRSWKIFREPPLRSNKK
jgi:hypothetical protein